MPRKAKNLFIALFLSTVVSSGCASGAFAKSSELASWNDGPSKQSILDFVKAVTDKKSEFYVKPEDRIAVFDNDGTLFCEQPMYTQIRFAMDRAKQLAEKDPALKDKEPFKWAVQNDSTALVAAGARGSMELIAATHSGMDTDEFATIAKQWAETAIHPRFKKPYVECVYKPMLEVLDYLRKNEFKTYIVSGGGIEFMRAWTDRVYDIPPEQVVGSSCKLKYEVKDGKPEIEHLGEIDFIDDGEQKPVGIEKFIGKRPIAAFGNSDGDLAMLQWTAGGKGKRLAAIVHHTDATREFAYDRDSKIGRLNKALDEATEKHWTVINMKSDWNKVFSFD